MKWVWLAPVCIALGLSSCANPHPTNKKDPYESMNRVTFAIDMAGDHLIARPITQAYQFITPKGVQVGIHNAVTNLEAPVTIGNDLLQGKFKFALSDFSRFIINSVWGIGGLFDIAKKMSLPPHNEDFGLTLDYWGDQGVSHYLVLPILGPSTVAASFGLPWDWAMNPFNHLPNHTLNDALLVSKGVDTRAQYMAVNSSLDSAFSPYIFVRSFYMRIRAEEVKENKLSYHQYREQFLQEQALFG